MKSSLIPAYNYNTSIREHIKTLNEPLLKTCGLSLLAFRRFSNTGELFYLYNNQSWMEYSFDHMCWNSSSFEKRIQQLSTQKFLNYVWPDYPDPNDSVYCALYDQNIWNGIIMYRKYEDCVETFAFATQRENNMIKSFYADSINILNDYILYFKDKAHSFLHPEDQKLFIPYSLNIPNHFSLSEEKINSFLEQTKISKYFLMIKGRDIPLSKREVECLYYLSKGKTMKEIAHLFNLSPRTVESYLDSAKLKAQVNTNELVEACSKTKFITNLFQDLMERRHENK